MGSWFVRDRREAWKRYCLKRFGRDHLFSADIGEAIDDMNRTDDVAGAEQYNVHVYKVLPYPPNTKDVKEFFIQKT